MVKTICTFIKLICNSEKVIGAGFRKFSIFHYYSLTNMKRPSDQLFAKTPSQMRESKCELMNEEIDERKEREEFQNICPKYQTLNPRASRRSVPSWLPTRDCLSPQNINFNGIRFAESSRRRCLRTTN